MNDKPQVIIFPRGQLDPKDRERLTKAGIIAVEADNPKDVVSALPLGSTLNSDDLLYAAIAAVHMADTDNRPRVHLAKNLYDIVAAKRRVP